MTDSNKNVLIWCSRRYGNFLGAIQFIIITHYIILYDKHYHAYTPGKFLVNRKKVAGNNHYFHNPHNFLFSFVSRLMTETQLAFSGTSKPTHSHIRPFK